jgi:hypothetical protein
MVDGSVRWALLGVGLLAACAREEPASDDDEDPSERKRRPAASSAPARGLGSSSASPAHAPRGASSSAVRPAESSAGPAAAPLARCEALPPDAGGWALDRATLLAAVAPLEQQIADLLAHLRSTGCATSKEMASGLEACIERLGHTRVSVDLAPPDRSACSMSVRTREAAGRRFFQLALFVGEEGRFHSESYVFEAGASAPYYAGFSGNAKLCGGGADEGDRGTSARMRADWERLDPALKAFVCTDGSPEARWP